MRGWVWDLLIGWILGSIVGGVIGGVIAVMAAPDYSSQLELGGTLLFTALGVWWMRVGRANEAARRG